jgi:hypothetical protein
VLQKIREALLDDEGQGLVEFALVTLFVIVPVMVAIIDGSILFYKWVAVNNAAREGARAGAIYQDSITSHGLESEMDAIDGRRRIVIADAVVAVIGPLASLDELDVDYPDSPCLVGQGPVTCGECQIYDIYRTGVCLDGEYQGGGHRVRVTVTHHHSTLVGLVIGVDTVDLTATATMKIEPGGVAISAP